jgi:SpoVK/Ycf46/Vps4 family AAA+-type ATPase
MAVNTIELHEVRHPDKAARERYDDLVGIDAQKQAFIEFLVRVLAPDRITEWQKKHHNKGLPLTRRIENRPPLVILAGDAGCGKTALVASVGTPLSEALDRRLVALETPSDVRGGGLVGQLSERITATFNEARTKVGRDAGILIIDEGDDLGTSRSQMQAHHEDRAGVNVLIKEIDRLARERCRLAVVLVTNRLLALDAAVVRRGHVIRFERPNAAARRALFEKMLVGVDHEAKDINALVHASERTPPFSYSDLVERGAEAALLAALRADEPFSVAALLAVVRHLEPSPMIEDGRP